MGFVDKLKGKTAKVVDRHGDKIKGGFGKVGDFVDKKTKGKHHDKIQSAKTKAEGGLDKLDGKNDGKRDDTTK